jgi:hypothetical protein
MRKNPLYAYVCFSALAILGWSNLRGWDPFDFVAATASRSSFFGPIFFHK